MAFDRQRTLGATEQRRASTPQAAWIVRGLALLMVGTISGRTLWIDEFATATLAGQPNPLLALRYAIENLGSEALMPGWVVLTNLAGALFGTSELGLRAPNAAWLAIAVLLMAGIGTRRTNIGPAVAFAVLPFIWYYGHEARPYALQLLLGAYWVWAAWKLESSGWGVGRWALVAATTAMVWSGLTAAIVGVAMSLTFVFLGRRHLRPTRRTFGMALASVILIGPVVTYYAYAVLFGGASGARLWQIGIANLGFAAYEILGFVGLGPGRLDLRDAGLLGLAAVIDLLRIALMPLIVLGVAWLATLAVLAKHLTSAPPCIPPAVRRFLYVGSVSMIAGVVALFAAAVVAEFPVWGRHFSPVVPIFAALLGLVSQSLWQRAPRRSPFGAVALAVLTSMLVVSSTQLRLLERHQVEDYRAAVAIAESALAEGLTVAWFANMTAFGYYLPGQDVFERVFRPTSYPYDVDGPELIVLSKPDIHDPRGIVMKSLGEAHQVIDCSFKIRGFTFSVLGTRDSALCRRIGAGGSSNGADMGLHLSPEIVSLWTFSRLYSQALASSPGRT
jgi:hypothetical protein